MSHLLPSDYSELLTEVKRRVREAQYQALRAVNKEMIALYWDIGHLIAERQAGKSWGKAVVARLAADLRQEFPGVRGFSVQNLWYMRQFFLAYSANEKLQPLVGEISWAKNLVIMSRCKEPMEREFYLKMTRKFGWTKAVLIHQVDNQSYEKTLLGQTNFERALSPKLRAQARLAVQDEYTFDFLELGQEHSERELERALVKEKKRTIVEYALRDARKPIGVATYRTVKKLPRELKGLLPSPEEIIRLLEEVDEA